MRKPSNYSAVPELIVMVQEGKNICLMRVHIVRRNGVWGHEYRFCGEMRGALQLAGDAYRAHEWCEHMNNKENRSDQN